MEAGELVATLEHLGVRLWSDAGQLRFRAPRGVMTAGRRDALRDNRDEVLDHLHDRAREGALAPDVASWGDPFPLTDVQSAYLLGRSDSFAYGGAPCQIYTEVTFPDLDPERLEAAWHEVVQRHGMLRAVFSRDRHQRVLAEVPRYRIRVDDRRGAPPSTVEDTLAQTRAEMDHHAYKPDEWPLFDVRVTRADGRAVLHISVDFLVADYTSIRTILEELGLLYADARSKLPALEISFRDYFQAERLARETGRYDRDRRYWLDRVDDLPPAPDLPVVPHVPRGPVTFVRRTAVLDAVRWRALQDVAKAYAVTPSVSVLSAFAEVVGRWSRRPDFTINLTLLNRQPLHPQVDQLVGDFTSVTLLAVTQDVTASFGGRASLVQHQLWEDMDHRQCSGVEVIRELVRRRGPGEALMPVVFTSTIGRDEADGRGGLLDDGDVTYATSQTPQVWIDCQAIERDGTLVVNWDVRRGVFPEGVAEDMFEVFERLLGQLADSTATWEDTSPVPLLERQAERRRAANATAGRAPQALIHENLLAQASRAPERLAVVANGLTLTYGELTARAASAAAWLRAHDCEPRERVAVVMEKGWEQVVAVVGVLMAGGVYVPVDANQPVARRTRMLEDSGVRHVLTQSRLADDESWPEDCVVLAVDELHAPARPAEIPLPMVGCEDPAYVIYTSGSTGTPKGVVMSHRGAQNTIEDITQRFGITERDRVLALANLGFDLSVYDIFGVLGCGGCLVMPDAQRSNDPSHWAALVAEYGVTLWNSVPAQMQMLHAYLAQANADELPTLRVALLSGDWIPVALPDQVRRCLPDIQLVSLGGATEAGIWSIFHPIGTVPPEWRSIPYGRPLTNQRFYVLDRAMRPCPEWVTGELYIAGLGLADGYLDDAARTAERFVTHAGTGERLYRTGDLGRFLPTGEIEFLGREDSQVKIRGHRIELAEIEVALASHPSVRSATVIVDGDDPTARRLAAFVTPARSEPALDVPSLKGHLADLLPAYMHPAYLEIVDELPLTTNGKIDTGALRSLLPRAAGTPSADEEPVGPVEQAVAAVWCELLGLPRVGRGQGFYEIGGDSLLAAQVTSRLLETILEAEGWTFDDLLREVLEGPTVASLAAQIASPHSRDPAMAHSGQSATLELAALGLGIVEPISLVS